MNPRVGSTVSQELFVFHKCALLQYVHCTTLTEAFLRLPGTSTICTDCLNDAPFSPLFSLLFPTSLLSPSSFSSVRPSSFAVRPVQSSDLSAVEKLVGGLEGGEGVIADVKRYVEARRDLLGEGATPLSAVVAECAQQVVGVAILRQEEVSTESVHW